MFHVAALPLRPGRDVVAAVDTGAGLDEWFADDGAGSVAAADFDDDNGAAAADEVDAAP